MTTTTANLGLFEYVSSTDQNLAFNIGRALNQNWDKIDKFASDIQVDIDQVATDLNGKAVTDLTNVTDMGYIKMAEAGIPSDTYIDLIPGASGTTYTMPADGYLYRRCGATNAAAGFAFINTTRGYRQTATYFNNGVTVSGIFPVNKNDVIQIDYLNTSPSNQEFKFFYLNGNESEAN